MGQTSDELDAADYLDVPADEGTDASAISQTGAIYTSGVEVGALDTDMDPADDEIVATRIQIEETRSQMGQTIDAIQERLSPQHLAHQAKDAVYDATVGKATDMVSSAGDSARGFGGTIVETIRQNPIPAALAGIGLGWLVMSSRQSGNDTTSSWNRDDGYGYGYRDATYAYGPPGSSGRQGGQGPMDSAKNAASNITGQVQNTAGQVTDQVQNTASQVAGQVQNTASQVAGQMSDTMSQAQDSAAQMVSQAQYGVQRAQSGFQRMMSENPLGMAAGAVAVGIAVGLAIPETQQENELMGSTRDQLMGQAQQVVQEKAQQVQTVAQQAVGAATDAAKSTAQQAADEQGLTS